MPDTRITIHMKISRKVLASLLLSIPSDMHITKFKDILMWHNQDYMVGAKSLSNEDANRVLIQRGFFPAELVGEKTSEVIDKKNRSSSIVNTVLAGMDASK